MGKALGIGSGISGAGQTGNSGGSGATPPSNPLGITVSGFIDPFTNAITLTVGITPPAGGTFIGGHVYLEVPDQSAASSYVVGSSTVGGSAPVTGTWTTLDCGKQVYVAAQQPWTIKVPGPFGLDGTKDTPSRIYVVPYSTQVENKLVQANQPGASANQAFTLISLASGSPTAGTNVTGLTVASGAQVGIVATALTPQNVDGKLKTPFEVLVTDTPTTKGWCFQLLVTYVGQDPTLPANQFVVTGLSTQAGPVQATADGISVPHSFVLDTPTTVTQVIVWLQAGLVDASGVFQGNNIVPGITPFFGPVAFGSTVGTTDASAIMTATINSAMAIVNGLFGVAAAGVTNSFLGSGAVATINVQNLAITNPLLASLAVQASNLASSSVTSSAIAAGAVGTTQIANASITSALIAAAAVGTAAIANAAITNALIANLAVSSAQIQSATITGANIASATIAGANIGTATIAQGNMASASIGTAQIQSLAVTDAKINDLSLNKLTAGTATFSGSATFQSTGSQSVVISSSGVVVTASSNIVTVSATGIALQSGFSGSVCQLSSTSISFSVGGTTLASFSGSNLTINGGIGLILGGTISFTSAIGSSSATAGANTLPSNPALFIPISYLGVPYKIPVYFS